MSLEGPQVVKVKGTRGGEPDEPQASMMPADGFVAKVESHGSLVLTFMTPNLSTHMSIIHQNNKADQDTFQLGLKQ